jgi:four helix bundle protein
MRLTEEIRNRCKRYASQTIGFCVLLPKNRKEIDVVGHQLLRSATSVAAHSREASRARSNAEFCSKIDALLQEADESQLWLELLPEDCGISGEKIDFLLRETNELISIFVTIVSKSRCDL